MGYDTISGEKENGTLALMLSNPLGRARLLLAKYFVLIITVSIPLFIGMTINIIEILSRTDVTGALRSRTLYNHFTSDFPIH